MAYVHDRDRRVIGKLNTPESHKNREKRHIRKALGYCTVCGNELVKGKSCCEYCTDKKNQSSARSKFRSLCQDFGIDVVESQEILFDLYDNAETAAEVALISGLISLFDHVALKRRPNKV
jgi:CRISPR/Cas system-associated protein Cas10 (large subunit of type III CRISPR-Cas system)